MDNAKTCLITGCTSGIGKVIAVELARRGCHIIMVARKGSKAAEAYKEVGAASTSGSVNIVHADLASMRDIDMAIGVIKQEYKHIDLLINNAGVFKRTRQLSPDKIEQTMAVNYLAPFKLTMGLLPLLKNAGVARIVNVCSALYSRGKIDLSDLFMDRRFNGGAAYATSKLLLVLFTYTLARQLEDTHITVNCLHPGVIATDVFRELPRWMSSLMGVFITSVEKGALPTLELATSPRLEGVTGKYFNKTKMKTTIPVTYDTELADKVWSYTQQFLDQL